MSVVSNISAILKNEACKIDGVAAAVADPNLAGYLRKVAAAIIDEANSVEDHLMEKRCAPKPKVEVHPEPPTPQEASDEPVDQQATTEAGPASYGGDVNYERRSDPAADLGLAAAIPNGSQD